MDEIRKIPFNECFRDANRTRARYRVLCGSAGSGKSFNAAQDFLLKLSDEQFRGANLLVVRKAEASCRGSTFAELCGAVTRIFGTRAGQFWRIRQEPMELESLITGSRIRFRGMVDRAQRERIKSIAFPEGKLCWIWMEEASEFRPEDLELLDDRLRGDLTAVNPALYYQITLTFNPVAGAGWLRKRFFDGPEDPDVFRSRTVFGQNRFIDSGYARRMERRAVTDPEGFRVYGLGEWGASEGVILQNWEVAPRSLSRDDYRRMWMAQDFGFHHADCLLLLGEREGELSVIRELYRTGLDTGELIELCDREGCFPRDLPMYCDSAEPDRIRTWRAAGYRAIPVKKGPGSVLSQISLLRGRRLLIDPSCRNLLAEIRDWRWLPDPAGDGYLDEPAPGRDDAMAALRYATEPLRERGRIRTLEKGALGV